MASSCRKKANNRHSSSRQLEIFSDAFSHIWKLAEKRWFEDLFRSSSSRSSIHHRLCSRTVMSCLSSRQMRTSPLVGRERWMQRRVALPLKHLWTSLWKSRARSRSINSTPRSARWSVSSSPPTASVIYVALITFATATEARGLLESEAWWTD